MIPPTGILDLTVSRRAKIVATIGPASASPHALRRLAQAGMDVARLNFAHGRREEHAAWIDQLRKTAEEVGRPIGILQDLSGPKLRTGDLKGTAPLRLEAGQRVRLTTEPLDCTPERISINYPSLTEDVKPGARILLSDGRIELRARDVRPAEVLAEVVTGGELAARQGVNLPDSPLSAPSLLPKDKEDLALGLELGVDAVAISFVRRAADVEELQLLLRAHRPEGPYPLVIPKLERPEALQELDAILDVSDGVMVARGDLGVEIAPERLPSLQKEIIRQANARRRIVITATQMLESMTEHPRPTRAEATDVANAVFDGSDALMLSAETAIGRFPVQSVETMARIILDAEAHASRWGHPLEVPVEPTEDDALATTHAARELSRDGGAAAVAVFTRSGRTARLMSKVRPQVPILGFTPDAETFRQLCLFWGVTPHLIPTAQSVEDMIRHVEQAVLASGRMSPGQKVVMVASLPVGAMGPANFVYLHTLGP